ncbi:PP2C family serine/threonine-protein phosphatase [Pseudomonas asplenii]|uniref:PP2C family protein-serine/threonine phosphatase n=1 Tax=Pseudomonas asplenii TaxID=53407 RepID=UPI0037C87733
MTPTHFVSSIRGGRTADNRDYAGFASQEGHHLYLLADGSTSSFQGAELAQAWIRYMEQGFVRLTARQLCPDVIESDLLQLLNDAHIEVTRAFASASASYLILLLMPSEALVIHAGDCCFGRVDESGVVEWLTSPHCRANWRGHLSHAQIAVHVDRHSLTRCFSARREHFPQVSRFRISEGTRWILATDGFWADLAVAKQQQFLTLGWMPEPDNDDDLTVIDVRL